MPHVSGTPLADAGEAASAIFNPHQALKKCFGNNEILQEMVQCFLEEVDSELASMQTALQRGNLAEVGKTGHRLKGTAVYLAADALTAAATRVEQMEALPRDEIDAPAAVMALAYECRTLALALARWRSSPGS